MPPLSSSRYTKRSIVPTPAGQCAFGSKITFTSRDSPGAIDSFAGGIYPMPCMPNGPFSPFGVSRKPVVHMHEVYTLDRYTDASVLLVTVNLCSTTPFFMEIVPKS